MSQYTVQPKNTLWGVCLQRRLPEDLGRDSGNREKGRGGSNSFLVLKVHH